MDRRAAMGGRWLPTLALGLMTAAVCIAPPLEAADSVVLRLKPKVGSENRYRLIQEQKVAMDMGAVGNQSFESSNTIELSQLVKKPADNGDVQMELTYDRMIVESSFGGATNRFDTADAPGDSPFEIQRVLIGQPVAVRMSPRGQIRRISGMEQIWEKAMVEMPSDQANLEMIQLLQESFGEDAMIQMFQQGQPIFPEGAVSPGTTWEQRTDLTNGATGEMSVKTNYQAQEFEQHDGRDCLRIAFRMELKMGDNLPLAKQLQELYRAQGLETQVAWKLDRFDGAGRLWIDRQTGVLVDLHSDLKLNVALNMSAETPQGPQALNIQAVVDQTMRMVLQAP